MCIVQSPNIFGPKKNYGIFSKVWCAQVSALTLFRKEAMRMQQQRQIKYVARGWCIRGMVSLAGYFSIAA